MRPNASNRPTMNPKPTLSTATLEELVAATAAGRPSRERVVYQRTCEVCKKSFESLRPWAKFCNILCKKKHHNQLSALQWAQDKETIRQLRQRVADLETELAKAKNAQP